MSIITLIVDGNRIKVDPSCDLSSLFPHMPEPVQLKFALPSEWKSRLCVVAFWSMLGQEHPPRSLDDDNSCNVPTEALQRAAFRVQLLGKHKGEKFETTKCTIHLKGDIT